MESILKGNAGQTSLEYLLLLAVTFITTYLMISGPLANGTRQMLGNIRGGIRSTVQNGEWKNGDPAGPGEKGHPGSPERLKPVHF